MAIYKIADLNIKIDPKYSSTLERLKPYLVSENVFDIEIINSDTEIADFAKTSSSLCTMELAESFLILNKLCIEIFENFNGFFFHSSSLMIDNEAYVFTAKSGTGKSTHVSLWKNKFGDDVTIINDDKPAIRITGNEAFIYGTPWSGKTELNINIKKPLKAIVFIERGSENTITKTDIANSVLNLSRQLPNPFYDEDIGIKTIRIINRLFEIGVPVYTLKCSISEDAVKAVYEEIIGGEFS